MEQSRANGTLAPSGAPEEGDDVDAASRLLANAKTPSESPFLAAEAAKKRKAAEVRLVDVLISQSLSLNAQSLPLPFCKTVSALLSLQS